ncbi:leucine Rich repeat-containing domain protein [Cooperia oncophora]
MGVESGGAKEEDAEQEDSANNATVSSFSTAPEQEVSTSRSNLDSEPTLESTQSDKSPVRSHDRSFSDDSRHCEGTPPTCRNGVMDLSRRGLNQLDRKFRKEYGCVKKLIIRCNEFKNVAGFDMFKQSFVNLETLDISSNYIESIPVGLDNPRLSCLDLSSNAITSLPDLLKLRSLTRLDISSNRISSLKGAVLPKQLLSLNIASNHIDDLTEFMRLLPLEKMESISLANNPCISSPSFDYRIYILSVLPSLQDIDGFIVTEEEQLKGEWLYSQGKGRSFKPDTGAHTALVKYLERYCPFDVEGKLVSTLDQSVVKVMEKRREMLSHSGYDDDSSQSLSVHSPYGAWAAHLEGKENRIPVLSGTKHL